jgi:hypothetical protein
MRLRAHPAAREYRKDFEPKNIPNNPLYLRATTALDGCPENPALGLRFVL